MAIFAVSDIHGYYELFLSGLDKINFSDGDFLWCLGDSIDRGKDGIKIMQYIMAHDNMDLIIGNHELMMLNSANNEINQSLWLDANEGRVTYEQFALLSQEERALLLNWLSSRYVIKTFELGNRLFCLTHSYYNDKCNNKRFFELSYSDAWSVTWSSIWREDFLTHALDNYSDYAYTFITGHVPVQQVRRWHSNENDWNRLESFYHNNVINIDGGCAMGRSNEIMNGIIYLRLDDLREFEIKL